MEHGESSRANRMDRKRKLDLHKNESNHNKPTPPISSSHLNTKHKRKKNSNHIISPAEIINNWPPVDFGLPHHQCQFCSAVFWSAERLAPHTVTTNPKYSLCCGQGKIRIPLLEQPPEILRKLFNHEDGVRSKTFHKNIRIYNSMFAFTSLGANIDNIINSTPGPYIFKLNGQNHHKIGSLLPEEGNRPKFAQLYIHDTDNETANRMMHFQLNAEEHDISESIVQDLIYMLDTENPIAQSFRKARDRFNQTDVRPIKLQLCEKRQTDTAQYNKPSCSEISALIVGDYGEGIQHRDIIVEQISKDLHRISELHPSFMAMQYPILFPYGEDGYMLNISYHDTAGRKTIKRQYVTMREYYAYRIQQRDHESTCFIRSGKLLQQYIVDAFSCIEENRLYYIRCNQSDLRSEILKGIQDAYYKGEADGNTIGKRIILPSSFTGSQRYMIQNYHDAMAICRFYGHPDLFVTFTCNVQWPEIQNALSMLSGQKPENRPDRITRVFNIKLKQLMSDIQEKKYFGNVTAAVYTIEFQKRGLPHVHIIIWLHASSKYPQPMDIDNIISAEIPNKNSHPQLYDLVGKFMIHGPCGRAKDRASCMKDNCCSKHFPKEFNTQTSIDEEGFPIYRRRDHGRYVIKNKINLDNRFVVPYNAGLLMRYNAHINVEWCNRTKAIKYLFKYINKGPDRSRVLIYENNDNEAAENPKPIIDEIQNYLDCRYLSAYEAIWRIYEYHIHFKKPAVYRLTIHLPLMNNIIFHSNRPLSTLVHQEDIYITMFTEWMNTNMLHFDARELTYADFPTKWIWCPKYKLWKRRSRGTAIGRIAYIHPAAGELYYLRLLLNVVKGPRNYDEIRTISGLTHPTFQSACNALGMLGDDKEWHDALLEATTWALPSALRDLFVALVIFCEVGDLLKLWEAQWEHFKDDIVHRLKTILSPS